MEFIIEVGKLAGTLVVVMGFVVVRLALLK